MRMRMFIVSGVVILLLALGGIMVLAQEDTDDGRTGYATVVDVDGQELGTVTIMEHEGHLMLSAELENLPPGFHGFHVHSVGVCADGAEGPLTAAGPHLNPDGTNHPVHKGDLPTLLVLEDGTATWNVVTDRLTFDNVFDEDGAAIIVHANPDNHANIPERYGGPDAETLEGGDSGDHIACGVFEEGMPEGMMSTDEMSMTDEMDMSATDDMMMSTDEMSMTEEMDMSATDDIMAEPTTEVTPEG
jgi:Cu-Zn family superoxide dismutase